MIIYRKERLVILGDIHVVGSDNVGVLCDVLDLTVGGVGNSVKEVEHTYGLDLVKHLKVENYCTVVDKVVSYLGNSLETLGTDNLELKSGTCGSRTESLVCCGCIYCNLFALVAVFVVVFFILSFSGSFKSSSAVRPASFA